MYVCVCRVCISLWCVCVRVCLYAHIHVGDCICVWVHVLLGSEVNIWCPQLLSTLLLEAEALIEPGSHQLVRLTGQYIPGTLLSVFLTPSPELGLQALHPCPDIYMGTEGLKSKYVSASSLTQPSPQTGPSGPWQFLSNSRITG